MCAPSYKNFRFTLVNAMKNKIMPFLNILYIIYIITLQNLIIFMVQLKNTTLSVKSCFENKIYNCEYAYYKIKKMRNVFFKKINAY